MKIYLARHGQTASNAKDLVLGRKDIPLDEVGRKQAERLADALEGTGIARVFSSPLLRAVETANIVAQRLGCEVVVNDRLIEQDYGIFDGHSRFEEGFAAAQRMLAKRIEGGESYFDVVARVYPFLTELVQGAYGEEDALIVTHGAVCRVVESYFIGLDNDAFSAFRMTNCQLRVYDTNIEE